MKGGPHRVAILGGGMASLAAAYKLASQPDAETRFEITIYQVGWRLGGKCASSRNAAAQGRVEEHGLHVWFGCYANAFGMLRHCYRELGRETDMERLFTPQTDTPYMEDHDGWKVWPVHFPPRGGKIGVDRASYDAFQLGVHALEFGVTRGQELMATLPPVQMAEAAIAITQNAQTLSGILDSLAKFLQSTPQGPPADSNSWAQAIDQAKAGRKLLLDVFRRDDWTDVARRKAIEANLAWTTAIGMTEDGLLFGNNFDSIDDLDFRKWLEKHGAWSETLVSAPVRALYDLCFAYENGIAAWPYANFAAGAALNTVRRIALEYVDYVVYEMRAGMGDMVIAPIYEYLAAKGVKFRFFHRITRLELAPDKKSVAAVHFERQATHRKGAYKPLIEVAHPAGGTMRAWPAEPDHKQLDQDVKGIDLESKWTTTKVDTDKINSGKHYDSIILGISLGEVRLICQDFSDLPYWRDLDKLKTVETVSAQLWMDLSLDALGWPHGPVPVDAAPEPLDVWADRTEVLRCEEWKALKPVSLQYLCGPLSGDYALKPADPTAPATAHDCAREVVHDWLEAYARAIWPNLPGTDPFPWGVLHDPDNRKDAARLEAQYIRANINPSDRYVLSVAGTTQYRIRADQSQLSNLFLAGDWTLSEWNAGCVETAVTTGFNAARALASALGLRLEDITTARAGARALTEENNDREGQNSPRSGLCARIARHWDNAVNAVVHGYRRLFR